MTATSSTINYTINYPAVLFQEINGTPIQIQNAVLNSAVTGNNQLLVAAVSGKIVRVLSISFNANDANIIALKSGSGGTLLLEILGVSPTIALPNIIYPFQFIGWCDTAVGVGLYADVINVGASLASLSIQYITFTPTA